MKQLLFIFLLITISVKAQDFTKVDNLVAKYPKFSKVENLVSKIKNDFTTEEEKVRAAFFWLSKNIRYNLKELYNPTPRNYRFSYATEEEKNQKLQALKDQMIAKAFKSKTGVCEEYAQSFKKVCDLLEIESQVIKGNVRNSVEEIGKPTTETNHAWNAVKINNKWIILDATWAAGYEYNGKWKRDFNDYFYDIPKEKIFKTHLPEEGIWILRFDRITPHEFYNQPIYTNSFLGLKAELVSPKTGFISQNTEGNIELQFKNLSEKLDISYLIGNNKYAQKPIARKEKDITILTIKNAPSKSNLILFINKKDALHFKIL